MKTVQFAAMAALFLMSSPLLAANYSYSCKSLDDNAPYGLERMSMKVTPRTATLVFEDFHVEQAPYRLDANYEPTGASLAGFDRYNLTQAGLPWPDGAISQFFAESALREGGYKLRTGRMGGFMRMTGAGYSWAKYLCWR
jgi:hypothetical protein